MTLPDFLNLRRIEGRIVALFLALLLVVQLLSFGLIRSGIERNAQASIAHELRTGERVLLRLLAQAAERRTDAARLLAADYGFLETLKPQEDGSLDLATLRDALLNSGERIGATVVAFADTRQRLVTATGDDAQTFVEALPELAARSQDGAARDEADAEGQRSDQLLVREGRPYQLVAVPVRAPVLVGWVLMAFELDVRPLRDLKQLSDLRGAVLRQQADGTLTVLVSNLPAEANAQLQAQAPVLGEQLGLVLGTEQQRGRFVRLAGAGPGGPGEQVGVLLLRSFDEAVTPYRELQWTLLLLSLAGVLVFVVGSVLFARRISRPIKALSDSAESLGRGDYATPVQRRSRDEVGDLAAAFESMRQGIRQRDDKVNRLAFWDALTQLPNRAQFSQRLAERLQQDERAPFALLMLDLDRFKHVNDVLGHDYGDRLLCGVAQRLAALGLAEAQGLARLGGDEFVLLIEGDEGQARAAAALILQNFETPLQIDEQTVDLGAGIGIALSPAHGREVGLLLARAELAMYAAKRRQSGSMVYAPALDAGSQESLTLLSELRRAIEKAQLRLYLQPKVDLKSGQIISAEALVRWQHPERGLVPPMQFIPFAEQTGFIRQLSAWVVEASARAAAQAWAQGQRLRYSVNLSTRDLLDQDLPAKIEQMIRRHGTPAEALCLEITESAIMDDPQRALNTLERLSEMGFKLSIDDFGTGYSSLAYLKRLPVNELKIDKSFVMGMEQDHDDRKIVRSTIELAHALGLAVVAEGVETAKAWRLLAQLGCDEGQGYFISRPMPEQDFLAFVQRWQPPDLGAASSDTLQAGLG